MTTQGADLLAKNRVSISGNAVHLGEADSSSTSRFHAESKSVTLGSQLTGVVGSQVGRIGALAEQSSQTPNSRLANASALKAAYDAYQLTGTTAQGIDGINAAADKSAVANGGQAGQGDPGKSAFGISIGLGTSKSSQDSSQSSTQQRGTNIQGGNIDITAREGDISGIGTRMQAKNIDLDAAGAIDFRPTTNTATYSSSNSASSSGVGVTFGLGEQNGVSFQVGASNAKGQGNGSETTYGNSQIIASGTLTTKSGGDTNLIGTQFAGNTVKMDVGGNLNIQTLQDTSTYDSKQTNAGFGVSLCIPPFCYGTAVTGSVGVGKDTVDHNYLSATNQAGISAGSGGFDINVKGNTDLKGAALTSTADKDKNSLVTGSLSFSDLENKQVTNTSSESASFGYSGASGLSTLANNITGNLLGNALGGAGQPKEQNQTSQTLSVISPATVTITGTGDKSKDAASQANAQTLTARDATTANGALTNTLTLQQAQDLLAQQQKAKENAAAAQYLGAVMDNVIGDLGVKYGWAEGGAEKTALHGLSGLIQGKVAGTNGLAGLAAGAANELLLPQIKDYLIAQGYAEGTAEFNALITAGSTLVGAAVGAASGNAGTAASVAFTGTVNNYLSHPEKVQKDKATLSCYSTGNAEDCATMNRLAALDASRDKQVMELSKNCDNNCWQVATAISNELKALGCIGPQVCDDVVLNQAWRIAIGKAEALPQGSLGPDDLVLLTYGLAKGGLRLIAGAGSAGEIVIVGGAANPRGLSNLGGIFSPTTNEAGGRIWTSTGTINQKDFATIVNSELMQGKNVNIISGVHGGVDGSVVLDRAMFLDDVKRFGQLPGIKVFDYSDLSPEQLKTLLRGSDTTIGGFCNSGTCLKK